MVAGDVDDPRAGPGLVEHRTHDRGVARRPVDAPAHGLQVDDVADQIERLALHLMQEVEQVAGLAVGGTQMDVGDEHGANA